MEVYNEIKKLEENRLLSKHERIVQGFLIAVNNKHINIGDKLPSVIKMAKSLNYSNRTVAIAYEELRNRGVIESKSTKGYFLAQTDTNVKLKVALVLFAFHGFHEEFYNVFLKELGDSYHVDIYFHHNNEIIFETISQNIIGKYGFYVISPIQKQGFLNILNSYSKVKTLLIDRWPLEHAEKEFSAVIQEYETTIYKGLSQISDKIKNYKHITLFYNEKQDFPIGVLKGFQKFIKGHSINSEIHSDYVAGNLQKGGMYFFISDTAFWHFLKDVHKHNYKLGKDVGVITLNDSIDKEIVFDGISTFSTSYSLMAMKAASHIRNKKEKTFDVILSRLILRNSH